MKGTVRNAGRIQGVTIAFAALLPILAILSLFPAVPAITHHFRADPSAAIKVPSMVAAPGLAIAIAGLFAGVLVDRFGRHRLLIAATLGYGAIGSLPYLLDSLDAIYVARLALGFPEALLITALNTLIADYWDEAGRRYWLTVQGLAGPALSSGILYFAGSLVAWRWNGAFLLYLVAIPLAAAMSAYLQDPSEGGRAAVERTSTSPARPAVHWPWRTMAGIAGLTLFCSIAFHVFIINGAVVWHEIGVRDPREVGRITAIPTLFVLLGAGLFWIEGRLGLAWVWQVATCLGLMGAGLAMMGLAVEWRGLVAGAIVQQSGAGMTIPVLVGWALGQLPFEHRGRGIGLWAACFAVGQFLSPLLVGLLRAAMGGSMRAAFVVMGTGAIAGAAVAVVVMSRGLQARAQVSIR